MQSTTLTSIQSTTETGVISTQTYEPIITTETYAPIITTETYAPITAQVKQTTETPFYEEGEVYGDDEDKTWTRRTFDGVSSSDLFISNKVSERISNIHINTFLVYHK